MINKWHLSYFIAEIVRDRSIELISRAYTSISISEFSKYIGMSEDKAHTQALKVPGWTINDREKLIYPVRRQPTEYQNVLAEKQLTTLTDFVSFLEKWLPIDLSTYLKSNKTNKMFILFILKIFWLRGVFETSMIWFYTVMLWFQSNIVFSIYLRSKYNKIKYIISCMYFLYIGFPFHTSADGEVKIGRSRLTPP